MNFMGTLQAENMSLVWVNLLLFFEQPIFGKKLSLLGRKIEQLAISSIHVPVNHKDPADAKLILQKKTDKGINEENKSGKRRKREDQGRVKEQGSKGIQN